MSSATTDENHRPLIVDAREYKEIRETRLSLRRGLITEADCKLLQSQFDDAMVDGAVKVICDMTRVSAVSSLGFEKLEHIRQVAFDLDGSVEFRMRAIMVFIVSPRALDPEIEIALENIRKAGTKKIILDLTTFENIVFDNLPVLVLGCQKFLKSGGEIRLVARGQVARRLVTWDLTRKIGPLHNSVDVARYEFGDQTGLISPKPGAR